MGVMENIQSFKSDILKHQAAKLNMMGYKISKGNNWSFVFGNGESTNLYTDLMKTPDIEGLDLYRYIILGHFVLRKEMYFISPGGRVTETPYYEVFVECPHNGKNLVGSYTVDTRFADYDNSLLIVTNYDINGDPIHYILDRYGNLTELLQGEIYEGNDQIHIYPCPTKPGKYEVVQLAHRNNYDSYNSPPRVCCFVEETEKGLKFEYPKRRKK